MRSVCHPGPVPLCCCSLQYTYSRGAQRWQCVAARCAGGAHHSSETPRAAPGKQNMEAIRRGWRKHPAAGKLSSAQSVSRKALWWEGATFSLTSSDTLGASRRAGVCTTPSGWGAVWGTGPIPSGDILFQVPQEPRQIPSPPCSAALWKFLTNLPCSYNVV